MNEHEMIVLAKQRHLHQAEVIRWAANMSRAIPELALLHSVYNGGNRVDKKALQAEREGAKISLPHLCLPVARSQYHGLYIYLIMPGDHLTEAQQRWRDWLSEQEFAVIVCSCWRDAVEKIEFYSDVENTPDSNLFFASDFSRSAEYSLDEVLL